MFTYKNDKGMTITTACEITGGGWALVSKVSAPKQSTRLDGDKETKDNKRKKNE